MDASVSRRDIRSSQTTACNKEHGWKLVHLKCVCLCRRELSGQRLYTEKNAMPGMAYHIFFFGRMWIEGKRRRRRSAETPVTVDLALRLRFAILTTDKSNHEYGSLSTFGSR